MTEHKVLDRTLTAVDRCDKCSSQAYYITVFSFGELFFCRHHFLANEEALRELAVQVVDQSEDLSRRHETGAYPEEQSS